MIQDPLYHVKISSGDLRLTCKDPHCDHFCDTIIEEDDYIFLGEAIAQIEIDNGWEDGLCDACFTEKEKWELIYERAEMEIKSQREECAR
jgi:hypothetical protein